MFDFNAQKELQVPKFIECKYTVKLLNDLLDDLWGISC